MTFVWFLSIIQLHAGINEEPPTHNCNPSMNVICSHRYPLASPTPFIYTKTPTLTRATCKNNDIICFSASLWLPILSTHVKGNYHNNGNRPWQEPIGFPFYCHRTYIFVPVGDQSIVMVIPVSSLLGFVVPPHRHWGMNIEWDILVDNGLGFGGWVFNMSSEKKCYPGSEPRLAEQ